MRILKHQDASLKLLYSELFLIAYVAHRKCKWRGVDSVTAVLLKGYCIYTESGQLAKNFYVSKSGRVKEQTLQSVT